MMQSSCVVIPSSLACLWYSGSYWFLTAQENHESYIEMYPAIIWPPEAVGYCGSWHSACVSVSC